MRLLLVHGAWHAGYCWAPLVPHLEAAGHRVVAPDLPGHAAGGADPARQSLEGYIETVVDRIEAESGPVVLVGHSLGGVVASAAAERATPGQVVGLLYVSGVLPRSGQSMMSALLPRYDEPMGVPVSGGTALSLTRRNLTHFFYHDCLDVVNQAARQSVVQAVEPMETPVELSAGRYGQVPRAYLFCDHDRVVTPDAQRRMVRRSVCQASAHLPSGHMPMFSQPEALASALGGLLHRLCTPA